MYNGVGLPTARGSGTNAYVTRNFAIVHKREKVKVKEDLRSDHANRQPNKEILDHARKRKIEVKCAEFADVLEEQGFTQDEIESRLESYRTMLRLHEKEDLQADQLRRQVLQETHHLAEANIEKNNFLREAFGISKYFVEGTSLDPERRQREAKQKVASEKTYELVRTPTPEKQVIPKKDVKTKESSQNEKKSKKKKKSYHGELDVKEKKKTKKPKKKKGKSDSDTSESDSTEDSDDETATVDKSKKKRSSNKERELRLFDKLKKVMETKESTVSSSENDSDEESDSSSSSSDVQSRSKRRRKSGGTSVEAEPRGYSLKRHGELRKDDKHESRRPKAERVSKKHSKRKRNESNDSVSSTASDSSVEIKGKRKGKICGETSGRHRLKLSAKTKSLKDLESEEGGGGKGDRAKDYFYAEKIETHRIYHDTSGKESRDPPKDSWEISKDTARKSREEKIVRDDKRRLKPDHRRRSRSISKHRRSRRSDVRTSRDERAKEDSGKRVERRSASSSSDGVSREKYDKKSLNISDRDSRKKSSSSKYSRNIESREARKNRLRSTSRRRRSSRDRRRDTVKSEESSSSSLSEESARDPPRKAFDFKSKRSPAKKDHQQKEYAEELERIKRRNKRKDSSTDTGSTEELSESDDSFDIEPRCPKKKKTSKRR